MLTGEKPQSSVAPSRSLGPCLAAATSSSQTSCADLDSRVLRIDHAHEDHLWHAVCILATVLSDQLVDRLSIALALALHQEVAGVQLEQARQQRAVWNIGAVHRVAVASGTR